MDKSVNLWYTDILRNQVRNQDFSFAEGFMYKNIIFDFGGVVVQFNPKDFLMDHFMNKRAEEIV